ncbi:MAG TPA: hypothetical protein H9859_06440 [Candidatus Barnesiella excrementigallinarum]|nr:hypothetical protein [Candidatus Barnesiella excrementigallinarum]
MEEKKLNEKESLELITQMIKQSRKNIVVGSGNKFLLYGYSAVVLSIIVYALIRFTGDPAWAAMWFLMFLPFIYTTLRDHKHRPSVITYTDRMINETWKVIGTLFIITALVMLILGYTLESVNFGLMLPLALIYCGIGSSITGLVIKDSVLAYLPLFALVFAIYMLITIPSLHTPLSWHLYFGASMLIMMVIPGHRLNAKCHRIC